MSKKKFSTKETVLLVFLVVLVLGFCYYKIYLQPLQNQITSLQQQTDDVQLQVDSNMIIAAEVNRMQAVIDAKKSDGESHAIPFYDNSRALTAELNDILSTTDSFTLNFGTVTEDDYLVLRPVSLSFETGSYAQARALIDRLNASDNVMQISDLTLRMGDSAREGTVQVSMSITYFEVQP